MIKPGGEDDGRIQGDLGLVDEDQALHWYIVCDILRYEIIYIMVYVVYLVEHTQAHQHQPGEATGWDDQQHQDGCLVGIDVDVDVDD